MSDYRVTGYIHMESTGEEADYDVIMEGFDELPDPNTILKYLIETGDIQIIPNTWEEVDEDGVGV
jgi:hypothetical protein